MNVIAPDRIRNFAMVGHATSGKTTLTEAMLLCSGAVHRLGTIAQGTTVSDYHVGEQQRHISVHGTLLNCGWQGAQFNFIDAPGYLDFSSEAIHALRVADFALVLVNAVHGIGVGTELMWKYASDCGIPKIIVVNGWDKEKVDFDRLLAEIRARLGPEVFPLQVPVDPGPGAKNPVQARANARASGLLPLGAERHVKLAAFYERHVAAHIRGPY